MYCPAHFRQEDPTAWYRLMAEHPLATVISAGPAGLTADRVPLLHEPESGGLGRLVGHVAKGNPLWQAPPDREHLVLFQGPDCYVSPSGYATKAESGRVVPTWNYSVLQVHGTLSPILDRDARLALLTRQTDTMEGALPHPWKVTEAPADYLEGMLERVVGVAFRIHRMEGKWKVSQNQPPANRESLAAALRTQGTESGWRMAALIESQDPDLPQ